MSDRIAPSERPPWMTDQDWAEFIEWDRAVAAHYGVVIEPEYVGVSDSGHPQVPPAPPSEKGPVGP